MKIQKIAFALLAFFAIGVGIYPLIFMFSELQNNFVENKLRLYVIDNFWQINLYIHIIFGGIALMIGWLLFIKKIRLKRMNIHRNLGKIYVVTALVSSLSGIYIGYFAFGGIIPAVGFMSLGMIWFYTTLRAYQFVRAKNIKAHEKMMIYSYAACCAAVNLRLTISFLIWGFGDFDTAYKIVAWSCWIPNMIIAYYIIDRKEKAKMINPEIPKIQPHII